MNNHINGFPALSIDDINGFSERQVGQAFIYIIQILCCNEFIPEVKSKNVLIHGHSSVELPICMPRKLNPSQLEDFIICLTYKEFCWGQMIYQLSHEVNHMLMDCTPDIRKYQWVSEVLCEMASQIVITNLTPNQRNIFAPEGNNVYFDEYMSGHLLSFNDEKNPMTTLSDYLKQKEHTLSDPVFMENGIRRRNCALANELVRKTTFSKKSWRAVIHANRQICRPRLHILNTLSVGIYIVRMMRNVLS